MPRTAVDTQISARWIAPVNGAKPLLLNHSLILNEGLIQAICPTAEASEIYSARQHYQLDDHLLIPGLINAHGHAAMSLLRGFADDLPLKTWLEDHIWPAEGQHVSDPFVQDGTELAIAEMLLSGTTCFSDMYFFPEAAARAVEHSGIRAQLCAPIMDFPTPWAADQDEYLHKAAALLQRYQKHPKLRIALGPHAPYTVGDDTFARLVALAGEYGCPIQVHLHETAFEVESAVKDTGQRPIERLAALGVLGPQTQCVHMTQVDEIDLAQLTASGSHVVHCPESNMKLASGICPAHRLLQAGVNTCLGTDGCASNNDLNMLGEMRSAALLAKVSVGDPAVMGAYALLEMATLNGAKALGIGDITGSLTVGKQADIAAIALNDLQSAPVYDPVAHLLYTDCAHKVSHVWVAGQALVEDRTLTTLNATHIKQRALAWQARISQTAE
jgi:5-methylthioadenosine/S-adenosylhomocysteine deaminase